MSTVLSLGLDYIEYKAIVMSISYLNGRVYLEQVANVSGRYANRLTKQDAPTPYRFEIKLVMSRLVTGWEYI